MTGFERSGKMMCDMHVHSQNSHDSIAKVIDTAKACIEKGIFAFAVTDHCDIHLCEEADVYSMIEGSLNETKEAQSLLGDKIKILKGVEIGEAIWNMGYTQRILDGLSFDVIIGSVHGVRYKEYTQSYSTIDFRQMTREDLCGYMEKYFDEVLETIKTLDCDIVAHLTCPLRYINGKYKLNLDIFANREKILQILDCIVDKSLSLELNTSGLGTEHNSFMPDLWILEEYRKRGGYLVTLGSDAHIPENTGKFFDTAIEMLKKCGFDSYYYYENRKAVRVAI